MKNQILKMICLSLATLYLSACSKPDPVLKPEITEDTSVIDETTTAAATETEENTDETTTAAATEIVENTDETTTDATTETEDSSEVNPDDFYANFNPLTANVFDGNMIACEPEVYASQVEAIDEQIDYIFGEEYHPSLEAKLLLAGFLSNQNIDVKYKKWLFHMVRYFDDNIYIEREEIFNNLRTLKIESNIYDDAEECSGGAEYDIYENKIAFYITSTKEYREEYLHSAEYEETGLSCDDYDEFTLIKHEILHATVSNKTINLAGFFDEGLTVLLEKEYNMGDVYWNLDQRIMYLKMLIEVVGKDAILEAYSKSDWAIIEEELLKIDPDISKAQRIHQLMYDWDDKWNETGCDFYTTAELTQDIRAEMSQLLTEYYSIIYPELNENSLFFIYHKMFTEATDDASDEMAEVYFNSHYDEDWLIKREY